ncbi:DUF2314 domain-containing protein [soil metagenome]
MKHSGALLAVSLAGLLPLAFSSKAQSPDRVIAIAGNDPEMIAAMDRARATIEPVIQKLEEGSVDTFSIKVKITEGDQVEYFWLNNIDLQDGIFTGTIDNTPQFVHNVKLGQKVTVKKSEIADWLYTRNGKMYGNYTLRVLLKKLPADEVAKYRGILAD